MLFIVTPQNPSSFYYDPEEAFLEYKRREYIAALQEQQQRAQFGRELALEEERHRLALATIARQEAARRQRQSSVRFAQANSETSAQHRFCRQPAPEEILARRLAREQEEQRRSRLFHEHVLSHIFGVPNGEASSHSGAAAPAAPAEETSQPSASTSADKGKGKQSTPKRPFNAPEPEPHWSAAPERAHSLQEITSINRTFSSLKNTFTFPSGPLERLPESDLPRLAYNSTNASIHAYEHALSELLTKLDGIESHGFKGVREARKRLVVEIGKELESLETKISERLTEGASPAVVPIAVPETQEKEVEDVVMVDEQAASTNTSTEAAVPVTVGYDIEPEEEPQTLSSALEEPATNPPAVSDTIEVEPVETPLLVPSAAADEKEALSRPESPAPTMSASIEQPAPSEAADSTAKAASAVLLEEATTDEESEIEDAVHVDIENDEAVAHDQRDKTAHASDQEVEFELI